MPSDTQNVKLGVCTITFDGADLGYTKGGVSVEVQTETHKVQVDQFGNSPINEYILSRNVTVTVPLAETTLENLVAIMPGATLVTDTVTPTKKKVVVTNAIGTSLLDTAAKLTLHPISNAPTDKSDDFVIPLAATAGQVQYSFKLDEERIYNVTFTGYPDPTTKTLFVVGDEAVVGA